MRFCILRGDYGKFGGGNIRIRRFLELLKLTLHVSRREGFLLLELHGSVRRRRVYITCITSCI